MVAKKGVVFFRKFRKKVSTFCGSESSQVMGICRKIGPDLSSLRLRSGPGLSSRLITACCVQFLSLKSGVDSIDSPWRLHPDVSGRERRSSAAELIVMR
jgi:hypothetical protein